MRQAAAQPAGPSSLTFAELSRTTSEADHWPEGYRRQILLRWGDPPFPDTPALDPAAPNAQTAARQLGYANDVTVFLPFPWGNATAHRRSAARPVGQECVSTGKSRG